MAFTTLVAISTISEPTEVPPVDAFPPTPGISPDVNLPLRTIRIQVRLMSDDWVADGSGSVFWGLDASYDNGVTWKEAVIPAETPKGARDHYGGMPSFAWSVDHGDYSRRTVRVRVRYAVSTTLRLGLEWERS
jgi:hypothetical protein